MRPATRALLLLTQVVLLAVGSVACGIWYVQRGRIVHLAGDKRILSIPEPDNSQVYYGDLPGTRENRTFLVWNTRPAGAMGHVWTNPQDETYIPSPGCRVLVGASDGCLRLVIVQVVWGRSLDRANYMTHGMKARATIPLSAIVIVSVLGILVEPCIWLRRWRRRIERRRLGLCMECGYDLTGNVSGVCPECGTGKGVTH